MSARMTECFQSCLHAGIFRRELCVPDDEVAGGPLSKYRAHDSGSTSSQSREHQYGRCLHLEVHDALSRHIRCEVRVSDGKLRNRATLRTEEPGRGRRDPHVIPMIEAMGGLDEGGNSLVMRDGRVSIVTRTSSSWSRVGRLPR